MAPNVKSMGVISRHLSLVDLSSMTRSHSFQTLSRAVSDIDLQQIIEPEFIEQSNAICKDEFQATSIAEDYWGWDDDNQVNDSLNIFDFSAEPLTSKPSPSVDTAPYWDWPADTPIVTEPATDVLSLSNIEANLIQASNQLNKDPVVSLVSHDDYWAEGSVEETTTPVVEHKPQHQQLSYWDWLTTTKEEDKQATIAAIKQQEAARLLVSGDAIERSLRSVPASHRVCSAPSKASDNYWAWEADVATPPHVDDATHPDYDYWTWGQAQAPISPVEALLAYERVRVLLSAQHTEQQMQKQITSDSAVVRSNVDSSYYWDTAESQALGDSYWDERPATKAISAVGGYWDM